MAQQRRPIGCVPEKSFRNNPGRFLKMTGWHGAGGVGGGGRLPGRAELIGYELREADHDVVGAVDGDGRIGLPLPTVGGSGGGIFDAPALNIIPAGIELCPLGGGVGNASAGGQTDDLRVPDAVVAEHGAQDAGVVAVDLARAGSGR